MKISKLAKKIVHKYAAELFLPDADVEEKIFIIRNNIAGLYKKFMPEYNGAVAQIKEVYNLDFLDVLDTVFAKFVSDIDILDLVQINNLSIEIIKLIEKIRVELNNCIKSNKSNPAFIAFFMRKRVASTVERVLVGLQKDLLRQLEFIRAATNIDLPKPEITNRRRMEQTPQQVQNFVLRWGDQFGIKSMEHWGKIVNKDYDLAYDLMTAFLALNRGKSPKNEDGLRQRVKEIFNL